MNKYAIYVSDDAGIASGYQAQSFQQLFFPGGWKYVQNNMSPFGCILVPGKSNAVKVRNRLTKMWQTAKRPIYAIERLKS